MIKSLIAIAVLAAAAAPFGAQACLSGCGPKFNGTSANGVQLNGVQFNDWRLNGIQLNGFHPNGIMLNGVQFNDWRLNGVVLNGVQFTASRQAPRASVDWSSLALDRVQVRLPK